MKKRLLSTILAASMVFSAVPTMVSADYEIIEDDEFFDEFEDINAEVQLYYIYKDTGILYGYTGTDSELVIPPEIDGVAVKGIAYETFRDHTELKSVVIPDGVTSIGMRAFYGCTSLSEITFPKTVTDFGENAFAGTKWFTVQQKENPLVVVNNVVIDGKKCVGDVVIPDGIIGIGDGAFEKCHRYDEQDYWNGYYEPSNCDITSITLPDTLKKIGAWAFYEFNVFDITEIAIPDSVTFIGESAFSGSSFKSINIPKNLTSVEQFAFCETDIESAIIPETVTSIGQSAFEGCYNLSEISVPDTVSAIGVDAFTGTKWMNDRIVENSLVILNGFLLDGRTCTGKVDIPADVKIICSAAFKSNKNITEVNIPDGVKGIECNAFEFCNSLETVNIAGSVETIGSLAFAVCPRLKDLTLGDGIKVIEDEAFRNCDTLQYMTIPKSVTVIGVDAIGCKINTETSNYNRLGNFTIYGYTGTDAERYASEHKFTFIPIENGMPDVDITTTTIFDFSDRKGDANCDDTLNMADATLVMQSLANPDKYGINGTHETHITEQGIINADMDGNGLTNTDALKIQKIILRLS